MKRLIYYLIFLLTISGSVAAQNEPGDGAKLREKMIQYIQQKLGLSKDEAARFEPVFINYLKDLRATNQLYKGDRLVLQDKVVELRLRYRDQFKPIIGEQRSNDVFTHERNFIKQVQEIRNERLQNREDGRSNKRF
ncbi:MAG: hypothetical protein ACJ748_16145 [Flavisolibacter sp.]